MKVVFTLLLSGLALLSCSKPQSPVAPPLVGNDRDAHRCIASAGYQWCQSTLRCERSWELAQSRGFENSAEAFKAFCK